MALTYLPITVTNPTNGKGKQFTRRFLVDLGATYSVMPAEDLENLGIKPDAKQTFILANGQQMVKPIGEARFTYQEHQRTAPIVFGDKGVYLIGATTLEVMGLILDPINRKLKALPMMI